MIDITVSPKAGDVRFPISIQGGGHLEFHGNTLAYGAAVGASLGAEVDVGDNFIIGYKVKAECLMQFYKDYSIYQVNIVPLALDMTIRF